MQFFPKSSEHEEQEAFKSAFNEELISSEQLRFYLMTAFFVTSPMFFLGFHLLLPDVYSRMFGHATVWQWMTFFGLGGVLYEIIIRAWLVKLIKAGKDNWDWIRYTNTLEEMMVCTFAIYMMSIAIGPIQALLSPSAEIYFLFILLSCLRLDAKICLFAGTTATVSYLGICWFLLGKSTMDENVAGVMAEPLFYINRSLFIFSAGCCAAFITYRYSNVIDKVLESLIERKRIVGIFGQYVSPKVVNKLLDQKDLQKGETRDVCVMFLDIRGFTSFSENKKPEEVVEFLNTLFEFMVEAVNSHNGIINKFLGDGFMAIFGAPVSSSTDCVNAVNASLDIIAEVKRRVDAGELPPTRIGIGLHSGAAVTGSVGSQERKEYTVIGDVVNTASRVEQMNKQFESQILVTGEVWQQLLEQPECLSVHSQVKVKGREHTLELYQLG